ncbi:hypothetical protein [Catellatospora sp. NPDC049133]|uniref:hypothetical protein n=1 Tax=Catellatospora sp. NPDC049133 TaxID=3155499 RepID=UPI0033E3AD2B
MTVGVFLDRATEALQAAERRLHTVGRQDRYAVTAALVAREDLYHQIGRFFVGTGARRPASHPTVAEAAALLSPGSTVHPETQIGALLHAGLLGLDVPRRELLSAPGTASEAIARAAGNIAMAAEILSTHWAPPRHQGITDRFAAKLTPSPMTSQGVGLYRGAERAAAIAETARLLDQALRMDRGLRQLRAKAPDAVPAQDWTRLDEWATNRQIPARLKGLSVQPAGRLLRELGPATPVERSGGPRPPQSWGDVLTTVDAVRQMLRREASQSPLALAKAAARLGFAATAGRWKLSGAPEPSSHEQIVGGQWRLLGRELGRYADLRASEPTPLMTELQMANQWVRRHCATRAGRATDIDRQAAARTELAVGALCAALALHVDRAARRGDLLIQRQPEVVPGRPAAVTVLLLQPTWHPAPRATTLEHRLRTIQHVVAADGRQQSPTGTDTAAKAFPVPIGRALRSHTASPQPQQRRSAVHGSAEASQRDRPNER